MRCLSVNLEIYLNIELKYRLYSSDNVFKVRTVGTVN